MCGIAGFFVKDPSIGNLELLADQLLLGIEHRGHDATGMLAIPKGGTNAYFYKEDIPAEYFVQTREFMPENVETVLLHTRLATQGKPEQNENNHPVQFKTCFATHNGVIWNDDAIIKETGEDRVAEVDSIAVPTLVAHAGFDNALEALPKLEGSWALAIADPATNPGELLLVRGASSPLVVLNHPKILIWCSVRTAIADAWAKAIGTPPAWMKFDYINEGEYVRVDAEGKVTGDKFMSRPDYAGYRKSQWYRDDDEFEQVYSGGARLVHSSSDTASKMCYECGERQALFPVIDSYTDAEGVNVTAWEVPTCYYCSRVFMEEENGPGSLTYRYAGQDKVKLHHMKVGDKCYWCTRDNADQFTDKWDKVCEGCAQFEKRHQQVPTTPTFREMKAYATLMGDDPNTDNILEMKPGDPIPDDMQYAFTGCDACGGPKAEVIGTDGFAICWTCREGEMLGQVRAAQIAKADSTLSACMVCDTMQESKFIKDTVFGPACKACRFSEETRWKDKNAELELDGGRKYKSCADCRVFFPKDDLVDTTTGLYCKKCVDVDPTATPIVRDNLHAYMREAQQMFDTPGCEPLSEMEREVAKNLSLYDVLVGWCLREVTTSMLADPPLKRFWDKVTDEYERIR